VVTCRLHTVSVLQEGHNILLESYVYIKNSDQNMAALGQRYIYEMNLYFFQYYATPM